MFSSFFFFFFHSVQSTCRLVKPRQSQQIQNSVPLHTKMMTNKARMFPWNGWLFRIPQCALQWWFTPSFLKYSNVLRMTEVIPHKYHNIVIHKALSICVRKTPGSAQTWWVFPPTITYNSLQLEKTNLINSYTTMVKKPKTQLLEDSFYIPTIQISQKDKEIEKRLSWSIEHTIKCPAIML